MSDYIDREAAIARVKKQMNRELTFGPWAWNDRIAKVCYGIVIEALERLPSADVKPVVHGEWVMSISRIADTLTIKPVTHRCSVCGQELFSVTKLNFCPNCGADMRGKDNEHID